MSDNTGPEAAASEQGAELTAADPRRWKALPFLCLTGFMVILDSQIVILALPTIERKLGMTATDGQWVISAYLVAFGGLLMFGGRLADLRGRKRMFIVGTSLFLVSSMLCGFAWTGDVLIGARVVQGISAAFMGPAALAILTDMFPFGAERNKALAYFSGFGGLGASAGLLIGGPITQALGWEWIFFLNGPVGIVLLVFAPLMLRDSRQPQLRAGGYDPVGALAITVGLALLVAAIVQTPTNGWASSWVIGMLCGAAAMVVVFILVEQRSAFPLLPLRIFRSRLFVGGNLVMLLFSMTALAFSTTLSAYAQRVLGYSPMRFGFAMLAMTLMTLVGAFAAQAFVTKLGVRAVAVVAIVLMGIGAFLLSHASSRGTYFSDLFPGLVLFGLGLGGGPVAAISAAMSSVEPEMAGVASGVNNAAFQIGGALGAAIAAGVVAAHTAAPTTVQHLTSAYQDGFTSDCIIALVGFGVALVLLMPVRRGGDGAQPAPRTEVPEGSVGA